MKPLDRTLDLRAPLRTIALASALGAAAFFSSGTAARADLVGHWLSGEESLADSSGYTPEGTHDGVAVGGNAHLLAYSEDVPTGFTGKSLDLRAGGAGNVAVQVSNSATTDAGYVNTFDGGVSSQLSVAFWAKGFPNDWAPWISKRGEDGIGWQVRRFSNSSGACFTLRGLDNSDGGGSNIAVNDNPAKWHHFAAVWDQASNSRKLYVDGVLSHEVFNPSGQSMTLAAATHLGLGGRQGGGAGFESYFQGLLFDVRIFNHALEHQEVYDLIPQKAPQGLAATPGSERVSLSWTPSAGATSYTVLTKNMVSNAELPPDVVTEIPFVKGGLSNGVAYEFKVLGSNGGGSGPYSGAIGATPAPGSAKDILSFELGGLSPAQIVGTTITKYVPYSVDRTELSAIYTVSAFAAEDPVFFSGSVRDFSSPQTYTITAEDLTTKTYTVEVLQADPLIYNFDTDLQGWTQIWPLTGNLQEAGGLGTPEGDGADMAETRQGRSPAFFLNNSGPLTFQLAGGQGALAAPNFGPSAVPATAIHGGGFGGVALRDVASNTYILAKRRNGDLQSPQNGSFTEAELAPYVNDGKRYTLDFLDYNKGGWGWTRLDNVSIPGTLAPAEEPDPEANILAFNLGLPSVIKMDGDNITITLPFGTPVAALAPTYLLSEGATCNRPSGGTQNFSSPVSYTVTSSDEETTRVYSVSAVVMPDPALALVGRWVSGAESLADSSGYTSAGTHDGVAVGNNAGLLAYATDVPPGFTGKSLDLRAGEVGVMIANSATTDGASYLNTFDEQIRSQITVSFWAKGFPGTWNPWVAKGGENGAGWQMRRMDNHPVSGFTIRGLANDDGHGSSINVSNGQPAWHHFAGVWDESTGTRSLYVDGVLSHDVNTLVGEVMSMATGRHLALGARQTDVNGPYGNYFQGLLYDVRIYKQKLFSNQVQELAAPASYTAWFNTNYPGVANRTTGGDPDGDGVSNFDEFAFGLNPSSGSSASPIITLPNKGTGNFSYTRMNPTVSSLSYRIMTSSDLVSWTEDVAATAGQTVSATNGDVHTMSVTLSGAPLTGSTLFVRVQTQ